MYDDAARYLREEGGKQGYDVIICDSSDPVGNNNTNDDNDTNSLVATMMT